MRPVYQLYGREGDFQSIVYPGQGHVYTEEMWQKTLRWMEELAASGQFLIAARRPSA